METPLGAATAMASVGEVCPQCAAAMPVDPGFSAWCDSCGWNVDRGRLGELDVGLFNRFRAELGQRSASSLWRQLADRPDSGRRLTVAVLLGGLVAALVHSLTLLFLVGGLYLVAGSAGLLGWTDASPFGVLLGLGLLFVAWLFRPVVEPVPDNVLPRSQFPALYGLADRVTEALGMRPLGGIFVDHAYNASFGRYGWRRRRLMGIGLPLWSVLEPQERVALVGHELGHDRSGDATRGRFIGSAITTLQHWYDFLHPRRLLESEWGLAGLIGLPAQLALLVLSMVPQGASFLLALLLYRDVQRAEYRADLLGAEVSGSSAAMATLERVLFGDLFYNVASGLYVDPHKDVFGDFRRAIERMPRREQERIRRASTADGRSLDSSHPPTISRLALLQARQVPTAKVVLSASESMRIDGELEQVRPDVQRAMVEAIHEWMDPGAELAFETLGVGWDV